MNRLTHCSHGSPMVPYACAPCAIAGLQERVAKLSKALATINGIRNSIIGSQRVNWSEHVYPLVAALDEAGLSGEQYHVARANLGTLIERAEKAEARVAELESLIGDPR